MVLVVVVIIVVVIIMYSYWLASHLFPSLSYISIGSSSFS